MKQAAVKRSPTDEVIFTLELSDEELERAAGDPRCFPTFTCGMPMCGTGGSCGTFGVNFKDSSY
jgi:hypothetical protein